MLDWPGIWNATELGWHGGAVAPDQASVFEWIKNIAANCTLVLSNITAVPNILTFSG